jgi:L-ribulose-5-phosphate 4-epimerase
MLLKALREQVVEANLELVRRGLVLYTFGNVSGYDRQRGLVAIKPSGVPYEQLTAETIVVTDLDGEVVEGALRPSSDLATHIEIYKGFPNAGGVAHTHSEYATAWAQACAPIPCFGTTHADYFHGEVPVTEPLTSDEIANDYEKNTGLVIRRRFAGLDPDAVPAVLVSGHAPFCWGPDATSAAHNAVILEYVARLAMATIAIEPNSQPISRALHDKHYLRKHGCQAYYGQVASK